MKNDFQSHFQVRTTWAEEEKNLQKYAKILQKYANILKVCKYMQEKVNDSEMNGIVMKHRTCI
jgi:hypothetical protein